MRKLQTADVFAMARIIRASGVREDLREIVYNVAQKGLTVEAVGIDGVLVVLEACAEKKTEHVIYEALAGPFEVSPEEIAAMNLDDLCAKLQQMVQDNNLQSFFGYVSRILGKN